MLVTIKQRTVGSVTILELSGRLTMGEGSELLDKELQSAVTDGRLALLLDCSRVSAIDSQGIKVLVQSVVSIEKRGGKLKLLKLQHKVRMVLNVMHLLTVFEVFDDEETAVRSFQQEPGQPG